jgi:hypothetical protein
MGIINRIKSLTSIMGDGEGAQLLETLLKAHGIEAAVLDYDSQSRQVTLGVLIHGQSVPIPLPTRQRLDRTAIARLLCGPRPPVVPAAEISADQAKPPPEKKSA